MPSPTNIALTTLAEEAIATIEGVAAAAAEGLGTPHGGGLPDVFVEGADTRMGDRSWDTYEAAGRVADIGDVRRDELAMIRREPVIARVSLIDEDGVEFVMYVSRVTPAKPRGATARFASYRSPMGRLAALPVGASAVISTPRGPRSFEVIERALVRPRRDQEWDAFDSDIETSALGRVSVASLRALLHGPADAVPPEDLLAALLAQDVSGDGLSRRRKRAVVDRMGLRDQPVLDAAQDAIFRLPLNARVLLTGPPGSGKTTTLIKRLGMKLDRMGLTEEEQDELPEVPPPYALPHAKSWIMFTPTELLGLYVKEAFNKEGVPAPQSTIQTWERFSRELGRARFSILRSTSGSGFSLCDGHAHLRDDAVRHPEAWYEDFDAFNLDLLRGSLLEAASRLAAASEQTVAKVGRRAVAVVSPAGGIAGSAAALGVREVERLLAFGGEIAELVRDLREEADAIVKEAINANLRSNTKFLDDLGAFVTALLDPVIDGDGEEEEDEDDDEDDVAGEGPSSRSRVQELVAMFNGATRSLARSRWSGRSMRSSSRAGKIVAWLGDRALAEPALSRLGSLLETMRDLRRIGRPTRDFLDRVGRSYARFRRSRLRDGRWYSEGAADVFRRRGVASLELDIMLLITLRRSRSLLAVLPERTVDSDARLEILRTVRGIRRNQVVVDEATDFSAIQLACMLEITSASTRSLFACGDLHQRVTPWGIRNQEQLRWVANDFDIRPIIVGYRQSTELTNLAAGIATIMDTGAVPGRPPDHVDASGVRPALAEQLVGAGLNSWLAARILEIETQVQHLPSIAVFVAGEDRVSMTAKELSGALSDSNILAVACPDGKVIGTDNDIRVFDVRHIKGLEFEAVFFIDIDRLAESAEDLFMKYLYVGSTRAATYLGLTCAARLPAQLEVLRGEFDADWSGRQAGAVLS